MAAFDRPEQLTDAFAENLNAKDPAALGEPFTEDAEFVNIMGMRRRASCSAIGRVKTLSCRRRCRRCLWSGLENDVERGFGGPPHVGEPERRPFLLRHAHAVYSIHDMAWGSAELEPEVRDSLDRARRTLTRCLAEQHSLDEDEETER